MLPAPLLLCTALAAASVLQEPPPPAQPAEGRYRAWLESPGGELPFGLELRRNDEGWEAALLNGSERIPATAGWVRGEFHIGLPHYDSLIRCSLTKDKRELHGQWRKRRGGGRWERMLFHAVHGEAPRFHPLPDARAAGKRPAAPAGRFAVQFSDSEDAAVAVFEAGAGSALTGTFLTTLGDYRFLAGDHHDGGLRLSCFDGAHAFLFHAARQDDGTLKGDFWSGSSWHETWTARPDPDAALPDPFGLTRWTGAVPLADLIFPDLDGALRSLADPEFAGTVRILQVFGSWCPNCNDEAAYLAELDARYRDRGLSILGLAFEHGGDHARDAAQVRRFLARHGARYPVLLAGMSDKAAASRAFPLLDEIRSYPTTIFIDSAGEVRAVHQGFAGPATGAAHRKLRADFERLITSMFREAQRESGSGSGG